MRERERDERETEIKRKTGEMYAYQQESKTRKLILGEAFLPAFCSIVIYLDEGVVAGMPQNFPQITVL